jgi:uncharacterized membrane protein
MKTSLLRKARNKYKYEEHKLGSLKVLLLYMTGRNYDMYVRMRTLDYARTYYKRYTWIRWMGYYFLSIYHMLTFKQMETQNRWAEILLGILGWICVGNIIYSLIMIK